MNDTQAAIEILVNTKTRQSIVDAINEYGDPIDWGRYSDREILEEVHRSDVEAGEEYDGILAGIYYKLI